MAIGIKTIATPGQGSLSFFEGTHDIPFEIKRVSYIYQGPKGIEGGGYINKKLNQLLVCVYGSIEIKLDDGATCKTVLLNNPSKGLLVDGFVWREMKWVEQGSVLMVAASERYDESDYVRNREDFDSGAVPQPSKIDGGGYLMDMAASEDGFSIEGMSDVPFEVKRVYYTYDVPAGTMRGGHAHRDLNQLLTCVHGAIEILLNDYEEQGSILLDNPSKGLLVGPMVWHDMRWLEEGSVLSVLASDYYDESDYIRDYVVFEKEAAEREGVC